MIESAANANIRLLEAMHRREASQNLELGNALIVLLDRKLKPILERLTALEARIAALESKSCGCSEEEL
jgi:hypothetical protein